MSRTTSPHAGDMSRRRYLEQTLLVAELDAVLGAFLRGEVDGALGSLEFPYGRVILPLGAIPDPERIEARHRGLKIKIELTAVGGIRKDSVGVAQRRTEPPWPGLVGLSDEHLVDLHNWLWDRDECQADDFFRVRNAVLVEADRRQWPEGWWEDPSVVLEAR